MKKTTIIALAIACFIPASAQADDFLEEAYLCIEKKACSCKCKDISKTPEKDPFLNSRDSGSENYHLEGITSNKLCEKENGALSEGKQKKSGKIVDCRLEQCHYKWVPTSNDELNACVDAVAEIL